MKKGIFITSSGEAGKQYTMERIDISRVFRGKISEYTFEVENEPQDLPQSPQLQRQPLRKIYRATTRTRGRPTIVTDSTGFPMAEIKQLWYFIHFFIIIFIMAIAGAAAFAGISENVTIIIAMVFLFVFYAVFKFAKQVTFKNSTFYVKEQRGLSGNRFDITDIDGEDWYAELNFRERTLTVTRAKSVVLQMERTRAVRERGFFLPSFRTGYDIAYDPKVMDCELSIALVTALSKKWYCSARDSAD